MGDFGYGGVDEELAELKKVEAEVAASPDDFEAWEKLVRTAEGLEGGLNRNSSPQSIQATRNIYDRFLAKFPLFFGYWKKYADLEFAIAGTEAAEMIYERGVASIAVSVDLWANYCAFKTETTHVEQATRELFERAADSVGLDFLAHPFWDKYIEFEERVEKHNNVFAILSRIIHIPMHQYARYFERYRQLASTRPVTELMPEDDLARLQSELERDPTFRGKHEMELERELRLRIDAYHLEIFHRTQTETTKRWTYEQNIKRPYFHVTDLDEEQLTNWHKYLDFEESEGDYIRTAFLYERCVVTTAQYEEFWLRYARWMYAQESHEEEVRSIYVRASCYYVPIAEPTIRLHYALFEELCDRAGIASAIYEGVLVALPGNLEAILGLVNLQRRQVGYEAAVAVCQQYIESSECPAQTKGAIVAEMARLAWRVRGDADEARKIFQAQQQWYLDSEPFWSAHLSFELEQPTSEETETEQYTRVKGVHEFIRRQTRLQPDQVKALSRRYMDYLRERGTKAAAREYMHLDAEVDGPVSVVPLMRNKSAVNGAAKS